MANIKIVHKITYTMDPEVGKQAFNRAVLWAKNAVAVAYHKNRMPRRFSPEGMHEYNLQERAKGYLERKRKLRGTYFARRPLMFSGRTFRAVTGRTPQTRVTSQRIRLKYTGLPGYISIRRRGGPNLRQELARTSVADRDYVFRVMNISLASALRRFKLAKG